MKFDERTIGFIGAGKMATALAKGFIDRGGVPGGNLTGFDIAAAAREQFVQETGAKSATDLSSAIQGAGILFLAVKPQQLEEVAEQIEPLLTDDQIVVSIAAGITIKQLKKWLGKSRKIIRIMPNTPALVGAGAAGLSASATVNEDEAESIVQLMSNVGVCLQVPEKLLDAVTGVSGSGPAYVFQFIEALSDGGVLAGLPRQAATQLAAQTVLGAAKMVLETGDHPASLKDAVASPGGTTIAGLAALERNGFRGTVIDAVNAAAKRSQELGNE